MRGFRQENALKACFHKSFGAGIHIGRTPNASCKAKPDKKMAEVLEEAVGRFSQKSCEIFMNLLERLFKRDVI